MFHEETLGETYGYFLDVGGIENKMLFDNKELLLHRNFTPEFKNFRCFKPSSTTLFYGRHIGFLDF